jgi:hypothetical protein
MQAALNELTLNRLITSNSLKKKLHGLFHFLEQCQFALTNKNGTLLMKSYEDLLQNFIKISVDVEKILRTKIDVPLLEIVTQCILSIYFYKETLLKTENINSSNTIMNILCNETLMNKTPVLGNIFKILIAATIDKRSAKNNALKNLDIDLKTSRDILKLCSFEKIYDAVSNEIANVIVMVDYTDTDLQNDTIEMPQKLHKNDESSSKVESERENITLIVNNDLTKTFASIVNKDNNTQQTTYTKTDDKQLVKKTIAKNTIHLQESASIQPTPKTPSIVSESKTHNKNDLEYKLLTDLKKLKHQTNSPEKILLALYCLAYFFPKKSCHYNKIQQLLSKLTTKFISGPLKVDVSKR